MQSPTAQMCGTLVARRSSTAIAPVGPRATPALRASATSGAHSDRDDDQVGGAALAPRQPPRPGRRSAAIASTATPARRSTPPRRSVAAITAPISSSTKFGSGPQAASTSVTSAPQRARNASESSHPTSPAPTITTRAISPRRSPACKRFEVVENVERADTGVPRLGGKAPRDGAGGEHQIVPSDRLALAAGPRERQRAGVGIDLGRAAARQDVDSLDGCEIRGVAERAVAGAAQRAGVVHIAGEHVRKTAGGVGEDLALLDDGDRPIGTEPGKTGGAAQPGRRGPHDHDPPRGVRHFDSPFGAAAATTPRTPVRGSGCATPRPGPGPTGRS